MLPFVVAVSPNTYQREDARAFVFLFLLSQHECLGSPPPKAKAWSALPSENLPSSEEGAKQYEEPATVLTPIRRFLPVVMGSIREGMGYRRSEVQQREVGCVAMVKWKGEGEYSLYGKAVLSLHCK